MNEFKKRATETFETVQAELFGLSRWMYENPETAYQEFESSRRLSDTLAEHGFEVTYPAYGIETAFEATTGTSGPRVVICAEYDALPGVGHACGHNIIATSSLGAGIALAGLIEELGIRLTVLGTPAEEGGGGKIDLLESGAFEGAAASMLIHPTHRERGDLADPRLLAAQGLTVEYGGKEAHAAAAPYAGLNALDAFVSAYNSISALRQQFQEGDRVHGVIDEGGLAPNVIPAYTRSRWIVRALSKDRFEELRGKVISCFRSAATATGCTVEITPEGEPYIDLISDPFLVELFVANSEALGRPMPTHAEIGIPVFASTDMGNVSHAVPSIHPSLAIDTDAVNHQSEFAAATITESGNEAIRDGALAMAHTIIDLAVQQAWDRLRVPGHEQKAAITSAASSGAEAAL
jgi:amidohydrolase